MYSMIHSMHRMLCGEKDREKERISKRDLETAHAEYSFRENDWEELAGVGMLGYRTKRRFDVLDI